MGLTRNVQTPCEVTSTDKFCNLFQYVSMDKFIKIEAETPGNTRQQQRNPVPLFNDTTILSKLDYQAMILLSPEYVNFIFNFVLYI